MARVRPPQSGFTTIELAIVIVLIAFLLGVVTVGGSFLLDRARQEAVTTQLGGLMDAVELWYWRTCTPASGSCTVNPPASSTCTDWIAALQPNEIPSAPVN